MHAATLKQHGRRFPLCIFEMLTSMIVALIESGDLAAAGTAGAAALARAGIPGRVHPPNPLPARHRRDVLPQLPDLVRRRSEGGLKITWHRRLRPVLEGHEIDFRGVPGAERSGPLLLRVDPHPVAGLAVRFDDGLHACPLTAAWTATWPRDGS